MGEQDRALFRRVLSRLFGQADRGLQFPAVRISTCPRIQSLPVQFQIMQAGLPGDFLLLQKVGLPDEAALVVLHAKDGAFRCGQEDGARESRHVQIIETGMVGGILRLGDHRGDEPVVDAVLEGFDIELPDRGGGTDVRNETFAILGECRFSVGQERNLGESKVTETDRPGFSGIEERAQRDGHAVRTRSGGAGKEVVGRQVAVERHLPGGDAAVPDAVRSAGVRSRLLAAGGDEKEDDRKQDSVCRAHDLEF